MPDDAVPDHLGPIYDLRGLKCPLPVMRTRKRMQDMQPGDLVTIETTDPLAVIDIPHFCREDGHVLAHSEKLDYGHRFVIRKGSGITS